MTTLRDVERRLAEEHGTAELGVHLEDRGGRLVVHGHVSSEDRRRAVLDRITELLPTAAVVDQLSCAEEHLGGVARPPEDLR